MDSHQEDNFHTQYRKVPLATSIVILIVALLWIFNPKPIYAGFVLGATASLINIYILYRNVVYVTEKLVNGDVSPFRFSGMGWRIFFVVFVVLLANRSPEFDVFATVFGAFFAQMIAYIYFFIHVYSSSNTKGGKT
ncbi:ATP synthase subunit I [Desulfuribacillus stibiiarsenatis]|uniref:ATP synthase subunit I n=1 Tax=Desulfuribacillus stibiiarsenatis TaxID=1390249 RepID=UPI001C4049FA|nr:ATP synthase subunit I [Desulfuribacillus stibiiarsenatis]